MYLKSKDVKKIDKYCIEEIKIPESILMENSGIKIKNNIENDIDNISIVCGTGNNGGDGLVLARQLISENRDVSVYIIGNEKKLNNSVKLNYNILKNMCVDIYFLENKEDINNFENKIEEYDLVVDGIFGIGLSRDIEGIYKDIINIVNKKAKKVLAIDTPSGFNCSTGEIYSVCIKAYKTVTFIAEKYGFMNKEAEEYTGKVVVEQISIPNKIINEILEDSSEK